MTGTVHQRRPYLIPLIGLLLIAGMLLQPAAAEPKFPKLTGRVVDDAGMLDAASKQQLTRMLAGHENASTNQVVVVTLPDLGGYDIADYGYQLGRHWGIGQKGKDNGVLLIIARKERKVRIEVGYGLEGQLTDAISANIINAVIVPNFKRGRFAQGIVAGTAAIIQALGGQYKMVQRRAPQQRGGIVTTIVFIIFFLMIFGGMFGGGGRRRGRYYGGYYGGFGGRGGGGFGGGGFGGGGGGFGGGGASGGW